MNWPRAKTILIIAFLITDLILIAAYALPGFRTSAQADYQTLLDVLGRKNIYVEAVIPQQNDDMPVLYVQHETLDEGELRTQLMRQTPVSADDNDTYSKAAAAFIKDAGLSDDTLAFKEIERAGGHVSVFFENRIGGVLMEENHIACVFYNGVIIKFDYHWFRVDDVGNRKQRTISAVDALLFFMDSVTPEEEEKIIVEKLELVYWLDEGGIDADVITDTAVPAWKVVYNGGQVVYINAYE